MPRRETSRKVPFRDAARVADAEQTQPSGDSLAMYVLLVRFLCPRQALNASVFTAVKDLLLQPGSVCGVPYFDIAICAANR